MTIENLIEVLMELRSESMQLNSNSTETAVKLLMNKYNMLFLGEKFNTIYSNELCYALKDYFHFEVTNDKLNSLLPNACEYLNMKYEPLIQIGKIGHNSKPDCYSVILW